MPDHKALGEILRAFELRRCACRTEDTQAGVPKSVDHAVRERRFRSDHGQLYSFLARELDQLVGLAQSNVLEARFARRAAVSRGDEDLLHARALREFPRNRMLSPAAANDQ